MMTAKEVAEHTKLNVRTIYRMKDRGEIPYYRCGSALRFKLDEVEQAMKGEKNAKKDGTRRNNGNLAFE